MAGVSVKTVRRDLRQVEQTDGRAGPDTIKLWESYRDQAYMWRALTLLQIPGTLVAIAAALIMYYTADTVIEVPERAQPGHYSTKQLPDSEFIDVATQVVNLISSYQPTTARMQFEGALKYLWEPALTEFVQSMMDAELPTILRTSRSQMFFIDTRQIKVERHPEFDKVVVRLPGVRQKLIGSKPLPPDEMVYYVKMTTIPRNIHNEHGIVVVDIRLRPAPLAAIAAEDRAAAKAQAREDALEERNRKRRRGGGSAPTEETKTE